MSSESHPGAVATQVLNLMPYGRMLENSGNVSKARGRVISRILLSGKNYRHDSGERLI